MEGAIAERIDEFIGKLKDLKQMASPFTLVSTEQLQLFQCKDGGESPLTPTGACSHGAWQVQARRSRVWTRP